MITFVLSLAWAAAPASPAVLRWDWQREHRFYVESEVTLPLYMWFYDDRSHQVRVTAFQVRAELRCAPGVPLGRSPKRGFEVGCDVVQSSVRGAAILADAGRLGPVLERLDELVDGVTLQLQVRPDGRLDNIGLEGFDSRWRTMNQMGESLRLVFSRAVAGFDLTLPPTTPEIGGQWMEHDSMIAWLPESSGSNTTMDLIHEVAQSDDRATVIKSGGRGLADTGENRYDLSIEGVTVFDRAIGAISERSWAILGMPTSSSLIATGIQGIPISQRGSVRRLYGDEQADVGASAEVGPPGERPVELLPWVPLGSPDPRR
jgi:hypothetical protein